MSINAAEANLGKNNLALSGYDPVSYFDSQPQKGDKSFSKVYQGATYYFHSQENQAIFEANPEKYIPAYGGWCAWAMLDGQKVKVDPLTYKIIEGKNYLYYNGFWGNTLTKWNAKTDTIPEPDLVQTADTQWSNL
ncbi:YHS domain-containing protein [Marinomonas agarivorans]|nr:YHS domain-containing protein [Marinomonas agarivorans]